MDAIMKIRLGSRGFTLIELMIVVVVIGILAAIALPNYQEYILSSRRADARQALFQVQVAQEKWRANNITYGTLANLATVGGCQVCAAGVSTEGHYVIAVANNGAVTYTVSATPQGQQASDTRCGTLRVAREDTDGDGDTEETRTASGAGPNCWPS